MKYYEEIGIICFYTDLFLGVCHSSGKSRTIRK